MKLFKGDRVRVVKNPYGEMCSNMVGLEGVVTKAPADDSTLLVSLRFDTGLRVKCWLVIDSDDNQTLEAV